MLAEATIATSNGRVNGYDQGGRGLESDGLKDDQPYFPYPGIQPQPEDVVLKPETQATLAVAAAGGPTIDAAGKEKAKENKAAGKAAPKAKTPNGKTAYKIPGPNPGIKYVPQAALDRDLAKLESLSRAALDGDTKALDELRAALDRCPHIWRRLADLEYSVELKLINLVAGTDPLRSEAFRKRCSELRHHLLDGKPSSLATKMAASRVVMTWLFVQFLDLRALESPAGLHSIKQLEQAERRHLIAMRTFGLARQMELQLQRLAQKVR